MKNNSTTKERYRRTPKELSFVIEAVIEEVLKETKDFPKTSPNYFKETEEVINRLSLENKLDPEHIFNIMFGSRREVEMLINANQMRLNLD